MGTPYRGSEFANPTTRWLGSKLIKLPQQTVDQLMEDARKGANAKLSIDLAAQTITRPDGEKIHFDIDPAVASGVFVTTVTDVVGFLAFLGLAALWLM
mgnify:CR=1 FL=1